LTNRIIIDAWNVIWKIPDLASLIPEDLQLARQRFNMLLQNQFQNKSIIYKIIYDGQSGMISSNAENRKQDIRFTKNPENADQNIINFIKTKKKPQQWTIVSSDNEVQMRAKNLGASVISSEDFIKKLNKRHLEKSLIPKKVNPNISREEIDYWLEMFEDKEKE